MKPTGNTNRRTALNSWQRQPKVKNAILQRIRNVTSEIEAIQAEMHSELTEPANDNRSAKFFEDATAVLVLNDFKAELDQFRRILWFYAEDAAGKTGAATNQEQQANHMQRVNELVRALSPKPSASAATEIKPSSFFERLEVVMDTYMQDKKPVAQITTIKSSRH
ncbi:MAG TPA: hypothetical protein VGN44_16475 [Candidatus Angelobacter sp.]|jgi:hypothetical protein